MGYRCLVWPAKSIATYSAIYICYSTASVFVQCCLNFCNKSKTQLANTCRFLIFIATVYPIFNAKIVTPSKNIHQFYRLVLCSQKLLFTALSMYLHCFSEWCSRTTQKTQFYSYVDIWNSHSLSHHRSRYTYHPVWASNNDWLVSACIISSRFLDMDLSSWQ